MIKRLIYSVLAATALVSCHSLEDYDNTFAGNFDACWDAVDSHYCFFREKGIDWDSVRTVYQPRALNCRTVGQLFDVCAEMLDELRDGHVNLSSSFNTSYYRRWWSDYPQNYDARLVEEHYLHFDWLTAGPLQYAILPERVGYIRYASFSSPIGEGNLDAVIDYMRLCNGIIIDIRDNGGGDMTNVERLVRRFIPQRTLAGYISHKTGPGHDDFSEPYAYYYEPLPGRLLWLKPVAVLTNRSTFSAANNFASVMKSLPQVTIVGAVTGGGSGMPISTELPVGWSLRMSACSVLDPEGRSTENGVTPTPGAEADLTPEDLARGRDTILDLAIRLLNQ